MENSQRTVLVTGASRGIGRGIAVEFAKAGYNVVINYLQNDECASQTLKIVGEYSRGIAIKADVRNEIAVQNMLAKANENFGFVDTVVNNAGINHTGLFIDETEQISQGIFETNVLGTMRVSRIFLPKMLSNGFGRIINISSMWGISGASMEVAYSATKSAIIGFTKALSKEISTMGVTVNAIAPGLIDTDMVRVVNPQIIEQLKQNIMVGRLGLPQDIARGAVFLADAKSEYITGSVLSITGEYIQSAL